MNFSTKVSTLSAPVVFGLVVGWLTAIGGGDLTALILPSLLSFAGIALNRMSDDRSSTFIVLFAVFLFVGIKLGGIDRSIGSAKSFEDAYTAKIKFLQRCSRDEYVTNLGRKELKLEPLTTETFCNW